MTLEGVTGFYPLSPLQEGLLFESLAAPRSGMYFNQCQFTMRGQLNVDAFRRSWEDATKQHDILRTFFVWEGLKSPVQVVNRDVTLPFELHDWQDADEATQHEQLQSLLTGMRETGFRLNQAPLMRLDLVRMAADRHEFIWSFHHLLLDGWSMFQVLQEVFGRYEALAQGREHHPSAPRPYRDFIAHLKRQNMGAAEAYWKEALRGFEPPPPLIPDHGPSHGQPALDESDTEDMRLSPQATAAIQSLARRHRVTLNTVVQLGWAMLLSRYTDTDDVVFGTVISGRPPELDGFETMVGLFINTLPVRVSVSPADRVTEALTRLQRQQAESRQYEFSPLVQVQKWSGVSGDRPLFETLMLFENYRKERSIEEMAASLQIEDIRWFERTNYPLALVVIPEETGLLFHLLYNRRFGRPFARRLLAHLQTLVEAMADNPQSRLSDLPMLSPAERQQLLVEWNDTAREYPAARGVHHLVEDQADRAPESVAAGDDDRELTYAELNARANQLAHHLTTLGVGPGVLVGVCMDRSLDLLTGVLGILKAGAAYVPMDPTYPKERLAFMLSDTGAPVVLTQQALVRHLPPFNGRTLCLDKDWPEIGLQSQANPTRVVDPNSLAYVIYTSGSTGKPKGVQIEHRSLCNLVYWHREAYDVTPADRATQIAAAAFDASVWELWPYLTAGASLFVPDASTRQDPEKLVGWLIEKRITLSFLPTPLAERVLRVRWPSPGAMRAMLTGGDRLTIRPEKDLGFRLVNHYGPTENTVVATCGEVETTDALSADPPIGRPLPNTCAYIVDSVLRPVPIGVPGELLVGGAQLARGYWNRPDLTAERFIPDPFSGVLGARVYRTGDQVRYLPDGNIEFLGRIDDQVKIRGFRIEPGEIEAVLVKHPAVRHAVVLAREDTPGDKRLVAYVVPATAVFDSEPVRAFVRAHLPDYMQPSAYVPLEQIPLTANGKVDRRALPAPEGGSRDARAFEEPIGEIEVTLARIWADVLKVDQISRRDHFFELGGHSLLVLSVLDRMRQAGLEADVRTLFVTPTLADLAAAVGSGGNSVDIPPNAIPAGSETITPEMLPLVQVDATEIERIAETVSGGAANIQDIYPLAPLQEGMLFHHLMATNGDPYLLYGLYGFSTRELLARYLEAMQAVIDRHDILRTAVVWEGVREPVQVVWRHAPLSIEEVPVAASDDVAQHLQSRFDPRQYRLDVTRAPMMRVFIARDPSHSRWVMLHVFHHMLTDHTSLEVMQQEIRAHLLGKANELPAPLPFRNFVAQATLGISTNEHTAFFRSLLGDVNEPTAPFGLLDVHGDGTGITEAALLVDASLARRLRERARALGVTAASLCHLAWALVLARAAGRDDVVFGTLLLGRLQGGSGADRALGLFINTLPVRIRIAEEEAQESVRKTHTLLAQLMRHEHAPLALAQRCSAVPSSAPLFSSLLNCRRHSAAAGHLSSEAPQADEGIEFLGGEERSNYPLILAVDDMGEGFQLKAQVQAPVEPQRVCAFMHAAMEQLVGVLESAPSTPLRNLDVMPEPERQQVLVAWNDTASDYPRDRTVHELFEAQAERAPEAVALLDLERQVTYGELNARANKLAHLLISLGVGPEVPVGMCLERSTDLVVAILGILKAGGAYVPLDPAYPAERLAFMMADSHATVVITQETLLGLLPSFSGRILCLDRDQASIGSQSETNPRNRATAETLAYVMYTSGSTGVPKGVAVLHRNVVRLVIRTGYARFDDRQTFLLLSAISFDASTFELWGALLNGARCAIMRDRVPTIEALGETLQRYQVSTLWLTASLFNLIIDQAPQILAGVRQLLTGGEALSPTHVRGAQQRLPGVQLINGYGPTEGTTFTCCHPIPALPQELPSSIPIGRPIANTQVYLLDQHLRPVPAGVTGELYIGGDGVARGYLNHPELTAERFVRDPFSSDADARMYRTGDQARHLPDGNIEFLGRLDDQVKIRGYRIEPGEIEVVLAEHPAVAQAAVLARQDTPGDKRLVAYVVFADASAADFEPLRAFLRERLPEYMRPSAYVRLQSLPLTANGKIDRRALPAPDSTRREAGRIDWPSNPTENQLVKIWEDLLAVRPIGVTDNFFELGGHSLLAVRMMHEVERTCGRRLPLLTLFEGATIRQLGRALLGRTAESPAAAMTAIHAGGSHLPFFFLHGDFNGGGFYSVALARELGSDQPFYALHPHGLDGRPMRTSIEAMAEDHLATLRAMQPRGPYRLGGHCNGGLIALDMARRLQAAGEQVDLVAVLDTWVQAPGSRPAAWDEDPALQAATPLGEAYQRAISAYVPERFEGPVALFYSATEPDTEFEVTWQAVAKDLRVFRIPGNHLDFITRDVHILGALLRSCLEAGSNVDRSTSRD